MPYDPFALNDEWNLITRTILPIIDQDDIPDASHPSVSEKMKPFTLLAALFLSVISILLKEVRRNQIKNLKMTQVWKPSQLLAVNVVAITAFVVTTAKASESSRLQPNQGLRKKRIGLTFLWGFVCRPT
jgi:transcriptional regulator of met regulon